MPAFGDISIFLEKKDRTLTRCCCENPVNLFTPRSWSGETQTTSFALERQKPLSHLTRIQLRRPDLLLEDGLASSDILASFCR